MKNNLNLWLPKGGPLPASKTKMCQPGQGLRQRGLLLHLFHLNPDTPVGNPDHPGQEATKSLVLQYGYSHITQG
jgi:hypothetical protein